MIDASTVLWWLQQSDSARAAIGRQGAPIGEALQQFSDWLAQCGSPDSVCVWGNGTTFDNVILSSAYARLGLTQPRAWNKDRCYRTVKTLHPNVPPQRTGTHHQALDDAES